jgi:hypothetical protein
MLLRLAPLALAALAIGCNPAAATQPSTTTAPAAQKPINPPSTQMTTFTGTLRGGMMAIGGETTGWTLVGDGAVGGIDLDVARVESDAKRLDGKRVNVSGKMTDKKYVERGTVRVLQWTRSKQRSDSSFPLSLGRGLG